MVYGRPVITRFVHCLTGRVQRPQVAQNIFLLSLNSFSLASINFHLNCSCTIEIYFPFLVCDHVTTCELLLFYPQAVRLVFMRAHLPAQSNVEFIIMSKRSWSLQGIKDELNVTKQRSIECSARHPRQLYRKRDLLMILVISTEIFLLSHTNYIRLRFM